LLNSAATAALIILIASPLALTDSSFQLSFLAMGAIGGIGVPLLDRTVEPYLRAFEHLGDDTRDGSYAPRAAQFRIELRWATRLLAARLPACLARFSETMVALPLRFSLRVWELFVISLILQLAMLPLLALYFHRVALAGPVANVPAVTLTTLLVPLGFFTLALSFVWAGLARILAAVLAFATHLLVRMTEWFAAVPHLSYRIPGPRLWLLAGFFALLLVFMAALRLQRRRLLLATLLPLLCAAYGIARCPFPPQFAKGKLEVTILDVGQGDSIFVVSPHGRTMLVDAAGSVAGFGDRTPGAGPDPGEDAVSPYLWSRGFQRVDIVAATHPHQDHIGGLTAVLQNFSVGALWIGREVDNSSLRALKRLAGDKRIPVIHQTRGAIFDWDGVRESTLWPEAPPTDVAPTIKDNDSLVFRLQFHNEGFLLTGDLEKQAEHPLSLENLDDSLRADVLKVGHHGSKNSTTTEFLEAVKPCVAVVSAGEDNPYGHPSAETLDRLADAHVRVFGTQRDGTVRVLTDGTILSVDCFVPCSDRKSDARASAAAPPHESVQDPEH
jgi:competence protein ComEC